MDKLGYASKNEPGGKCFIHWSAGGSQEATEEILKQALPFSLELKLNILLFSTCSTLLCGIILLQR